MKINDVLWRAANELLGVKTPCFHDYSCVAVIWASDSVKLADKTDSFLRELGVDTDSAYEFEEFSEGAERQQARHTWLMFAYEIALEEGL